MITWREKEKVFTTYNRCPLCSVGRAIHERLLDASCRVRRRSKIENWKLHRRRRGELMEFLPLKISAIRTTSLSRSPSSSTNPLRLSVSYTLASPTDSLDTSPQVVNFQRISKFHRQHVRIKETLKRFLASETTEGSLYDAVSHVKTRALIYNIRRAFELPTIKRY